MDQTLKNRLVGAVVLLAAAAIVLPLLFDGANERALMADTRMPAAPEVPDAGKLLASEPSTLAAAQAAVEQAHAPAEAESAVANSAPVAAPAAAAPPAPAVVPAATARSPAMPPAPRVAAPVPAVVPPPAPADPRLAKIAEAWDVQVAAGASAEGAERLRAKLAAAGYKVRVRAEGGLYKTVVGPVLRREDAIALRDALGADGRVGKPKGMLVRYVP